MSIMKELIVQTRATRGDSLGTMFSFYEKYYDEVFKEVKESDGLKARVSVTGRGGAGTNFADVVRKLYPICDRIIFSPAAGLECRASADSRFYDLTIDGGASFGRNGTPGHYIRFGRDDLHIIPNFLLDAEALVTKGQVAYLPGYSTGPDLHGWSYPGEDFGNSYAENAIEMQTRMIAQEIYVSHSLSCNHVFPSVLDAPLEMPKFTKTYPLVAVIGRIRIPKIESCSFDVLSKIKEEEQISFKSLQTAFLDASRRLSDIDPYTQEFLLI
jgi:hypothetical protein